MVFRALGDEKAAYFFDRYLEYFFTDEDARFIRSLGLNLVRLPFNYRHFEDDMNPFVLREAGFKHLDRVIDDLRQERAVYDPGPARGARLPEPGLAFR